MKIPELNAQVIWRYLDIHTDAPVTRCIIKRDDNPEEIHGVAICSKQDQFNRELGRKISLSRALKQIPKDKRKPFWEYFRNMTAEPKW